MAPNSGGPVPPPAALPAPALLEALPDTVVVADGLGRIAYVNPSVRVLLGHEPEDLMGRPLTVLMPERFRGSHGAGFSRFRRTGVGELVGSTTQVPALRADGHEIPIDLTLSRLEPVPGTDPDGAVVVAVLRDASTTILLERQLQVSRYLAATLRVTAALTEAPDADVAFERLLATLCAELDWDVAALWESDGTAGRLRHAGTWTAPGLDVGVLHAGSAGRSVARGGGLPGLAWSSRAPVVVEDLWNDPRFLRGAEARADGLRTGVAFPVLGGDTVVAVCELFSRQSRPVPAELLDVLAHAGRQIGQFLGRLRAESDVRHLADTLQRSLLPSHLPAVPGLDLAARFRPGGGSALVGGDTYDVTPLSDGRSMVLIADVCGTGAEAAAVTALARHTARAAAAAGDPAEVLRAVNAALLREQASGPLRFVTACCLVLGPRDDSGAPAELSVAGHPLPLLRTSTGWSEVGARDVPLGVDAEARFDPVSVPLPPGASLVLYTDGVTEARDDSGAQLGEDGLVALLSRPGVDGAECIVERISAAVVERLRNSRYEADDLAVLALTVPS
ncbi:PAS domain S-box-containing protein [Geodermatophilus dictyosporus]|uniref:PAS domain S-box-containing protein n=1 Tax=Geodermatophilus dictyosporus TaxID=1523247 RepID=A0A1I5TNC2_9ACTN|nr:SpoIIE family protein phosphatase [Geodermatophilus dictyosporus]SFP84594.1 PAS domain S-box-containing protein [Geodermatophilus dictyosporus]